MQWSRMAGLRAKTVHQSPGVPSQRPGSATGSRPSNSHSYMVVTMGAVASLLGTWRRRGTSGGAGGGDDGAGRFVAHVARTERTGPGGELQEDAVGIEEVDAAHEDARVIVRA